MMHILIVGGTQGLGRALAENYLAQGHEVCVCGRDSQKLQGWQFKNHEKLSHYQLDISCSEQVSGLFEHYKDSPIDLIINCAGIYINNRETELTESASLALLNTNVLALNQLLSLAADKMLAQGYGHFVALSSVAALIHYPGASLYSATKRSVINLCDTYRTALSPFGIKVSAVVPGYINTAQLRFLNGGDASHKLFIVEQDYAAKLIIKQLDQGIETFVFPKRMHCLMRLLNLIPKPVLSYFLMPKKIS